MSDEANTVHDLNGSETTKEDTPSNSLLSMRKGLFGNSASLLNTSVDSEQAPEENTEVTVCEKKSDSNEASSTQCEALVKASEDQNGDKEEVPLLETSSRLNDDEEPSGDHVMVTNESVNESTHEDDHSEDPEPSKDNDFIEYSNNSESIETSKISNSNDNHKQIGEADEPVCEEMPSEKDEDPESVKMDEPEAPASVETLRIEIAEDDEELYVQKTISMDTSNVGEPTSSSPAQEEVIMTNVSMEEENVFAICDEDDKEKKCNEKSNVEGQKEPVSEASPNIDEPVDEPMVEDNAEETEVPNEEVETTKDEQLMGEEPKAEVIEGFDTPAEEEGGSEDVQEKTEVEENATHEETEIVEQTPKRNRRSLFQATQKKTPARLAHGNSTSEDNAVEESPLSRRSARGRKEIEKEKEKDEAKKTPSRGREKKYAEPVESEEKYEKDVTELKTPTRTTRHKKDSDEAVEEEEKLSVKKTSRRRGKKDSEQGEVEVNIEEEEEQTRRTPRGRGKKESELKEKNKEDEESQDVTDTSARRSRRSNIKEMPIESTSTPARRSTRTPAQNKTPVTASKPKNTPASAARVRPKRAAKEEKAESEEDVEEHNEEAEVEEEEPITPAKGRKGRLVTKVGTVKAVVKTSVKTAKTAKTPTKTPKSVKNTEDEDPYDIDDMIDNHPEPFKNIQMDVQSFGAVTFSKVGTGKYERTEKAAQERVVNLAELAPSENKPEKRKSLMDLNKKEMEVPAGSKSVPPKRSKRSELVELDTISTPKREKKSTTLPQTLKTPSVGRKRKEEAASTPRPKKLKIEVPELDDTAQLAADLPEDGPPGVVPGSRVFALYDKVYYPASVINRDGLGRFQVYFIEDAMVKDLPEASVIPIASLQIGKLASFNEGDNTIRGKIVTMPSHSNWAKGHFILEPEDEEAERKEYSKSWDALLLDMDDWKDYIKEKSSHATDVKMDNIESTEDRAKRRTRATPTSSPLLETKTPSRPPPRSTRKSIKKSEEKEEKMETEDAEEQDESGLDNNDDVIRKTPQKTPKRGQPRVTPKSAPKSTKKESRSRSQNAFAEIVKLDEEEPKQESDEEIDTQEPEPLPKNIDLFKDKVFILTSANRQPAEGQLPFRKNEMKLRILERGGVVVDDMVAVPLDAEAYLISDMHYRTHKYLAAMSRAMPCVSHEWIHECVKHEKLLDFHPYVLKGGVSILDDRVYDLPDVRDTLLKGLRVCVYSTNDPGKKTLSFCQIWDPIVSTLGATVVTVEEALSKGCDVTVTDSTCAPSVAVEITKKGGHVVSSEWLIQSIIMGARQAYDAHPRFQHDGSQ